MRKVYWVTLDTLKNSTVRILDLTRTRDMRINRAFHTGDSIPAILSFTVVFSCVEAELMLAKKLNVFHFLNCQFIIVLDQEFDGV
jgi:hypothetical protein